MSINEAATTPTIDEDGPKSLGLNLTLRDPDDGRVAMRTVLLGSSPIIVIEPSSDPDEGVDLSFDIDATGLDQKGLMSILGLIADALEKAIEDDEAESGDQ